MPPVEFEVTISAGERPLTYALGYVLRASDQRPAGTRVSRPLTSADKHMYVCKWDRPAS